MTAVEHVVLVGLMGSGKSTVGRRLARRLGLAFVDTDAEIERESARTVRQIFADDGEEGFRRIEKDVVRRILESSNRSVVAAGGGAVLDPESRRLVASHLGIWLAANPETLAKRVTRGAAHRPLVDDDPLGKLTAMEAARGPIYAEASRFRVDVDGMSPEAVADVCQRLIEAP